MGTQHGPFRIGVVSGKLGGVDGVSLEADKWIRVLQAFGHDIHTIAGEYAQPVDGVPNDRQHTLGEIRFSSDFQHQIERQVFPHMTATPAEASVYEIRQAVEQLEIRGREAGTRLHRLVQEQEIDVLIGENTNAMPMTLLGGLAMHLVATTHRVATIFHHHDFWWERSRFSRNRIESLLNRIMPPVDLGIEHVVISSYAAHILSSLKRVQPRIIPNCEDFEETVALDDYNHTFRRDLGFGDDDILIVQPTRIVPRKRIQDSVRLVGRLLERFPDLRDRVKYVISLYQGDEPDDGYVTRIHSLAESLGVSLHLIAERVRNRRGTDAEGRRLYSNRDVLANADLVTYLPIWEGFGNALLEAVAARVPVVTTTYLVYKTDIMNTGLRTIEIRDRYDEAGDLVVPDSALDEIREVLSNAELRREMVDQSFETARREFGLDRLTRDLGDVLAAYGDEIRASRRRTEKSKAHYSV